MVDNCCISNYTTTLNLEDEDIEKYFANISNNFSRNSSIRRSCRNFSKQSSSGNISGATQSRRTTPANSNRASPYLFGQFTNTVAQLNPKRATYYSTASDTSGTPMSSRNSTLSRNDGSGMSENSSDKRDVFIDNVAYYEVQKRESVKSGRTNGFSNVSEVQWNFFGDLKKNRDTEKLTKKKVDTENFSTIRPLGTYKKDEYYRLRKSTQDVNTVSIWCTENDERNAIIFHHESGMVENFASNENPNFSNDDTVESLKETKYKSNEVLNNACEAQSTSSNSLLNIQRNIFSKSISDVYNISTELKLLEKRTNLSRDSINLSQNHFGSCTLSQSCFNDVNINKASNDDLPNSFKTNSKRSFDLRTLATIIPLYDNVYDDTIQQSNVSSNSTETMLK